MTGAAIPETMTRVLSESKQGRWYLENGEIVTVTEHRPGRWGMGSCHPNARWLAHRWPGHYRWWVGYALMPDWNYPDNHPWVQRDGTHIEVTYDQPSGFYIGVPMVEVGPHVCTGHPNDCRAWTTLGSHP